MKTVADIVQLAEAKIIEGQCLLNNGHFDAAIYISGYAVELLLKAKVCLTLNLPNFFDDTAKNTRKALGGRRLSTGGESLYKPFWVHDYVQLSILSGLYSRISDALDNDATFVGHWNAASFWDESYRYQFGSNKRDATAFLEAIKYLSQWIQQFL